MASHTFTRQELYDLVWSEPMTAVAARYGISGRGLAKACGKAAIPVPERGFWAKVQAGHKVRRPPLPPTKPGHADRITISPPEPKVELPAPSPVPPTVQAAFEAEQRPEVRVSVPATLTRPHRIVAAWLEEDRRARAESRRNDWFGSLREPIDKTPLGKRRLRILSTLFKILEARGYKLIVEGPYRHQVFVGLKDEKLSITLEERLQQIRRLLTEEEKAKRSYLSTGQKWTQEKQATGELILNIKEAGGYGVSKEWRETSDDPLEARLNVVLGGIAAAFEEIRLRRERDAEERRKQWQLEEERRKLEMDRKREVIRYRRLVQSAENQQRAAHIRALVETVESSPRAKDDPEAFACWRNWALGHADRIDPMNNDRLFDMEVPDSDVYMLRD